jgi:3-oxoacyl-[acyl-carrier-protein] synthase-3
MAEEIKREVGIVAVSAYVPEGRLDLREAAARFDSNEDFLRAKTGYLGVARKVPGEETSDMAERAVRSLLAERPGLAERIGLLVVVTQNPDGYGLPHVSAIVHGKLGLHDSVAAFDVSLGCSGWVYGLSAAKAFMEANDIKHGLLVTADPYSKVLDVADRNTMLLFGDAATATLLGREGRRWSAGKFVFGTDGKHWADLRVDENRKLVMNGRGIFTFSAIRVPECLRQTLAANGLSIDQVDRLVLHQGSRYIVETIGERMKAPEKTFFDDNGVGNTVSSSVPLILAKGVCDRDHTLLVAGFGVGLSWAATILKSESPT